MRIVRDRENKKIYLCQDAYIRKILDRFGMANCKNMDTPMALGSEVNMVPFAGIATKKQVQQYQSIIGSCNYAAVQTRPDISYNMSILSQFLCNPSPQHIKAAVRVLQYLKGTQFRALVLGGNEGDMGLAGYSDSDFAGELTGRKSHYGYVFFFMGGVIVHQSKRQSLVATSSTHAEYVALCKIAQEATWLSTLLAELQYHGQDAKKVTIHGDNQGSLSLAENPESHSRSKHIAIKYHYVRHEVKKGRIDLQYCQTEKMPADGLTKILGPTKHARFIKLLRMKDVPKILL